MSRSRERVAPLTLVVGLATFCVCVCTLAVAAVVLHTNGGMGASTWQGVVARAPMALLLYIADGPRGGPPARGGPSWWRGRPARWLRATRVCCACCARPPSIGCTSRQPLSVRER